MDEKQPKPRTMSLKQVLDAADRASGQVASWPKWKQELSTPQVQAQAASSTSTNQPKS